ncbi:xanthine dehydrogenase accessory protein XdhC [Thioclava sp. SK-1]|uniref:xanthine dehydrogenase accessory protein XdhC n=1 Tax=Thioclava sp. SK-1 TaxID=1889770 RepID=UPI000826FAF3|nr:xanthine dehydrogenase accessory protein XdhC [Thioclava sp. SK-1]OCX66644.1 xanthine dehydrogenase accessory protein XdhC [Thioclava sp. SK-1]
MSLGDKISGPSEAMVPYTRVIVADSRGSAPREIGAEMLVWPDRIEGTIGGGQLEYEAISTARRISRAQVQRIPLGPAMGQCCGGSVTLAFVPPTAQSSISAGYQLTALCDGPMPLSVHRALARARDRGDTPARLLDGWLIEPKVTPHLPIWVWGAGHVGRALVQVLAPLPGIAVTWADTGSERFPPRMPDNVRPVTAHHLPDLVSLAPKHAQHFVLTYSHALDLELCHRMLCHGFGRLGLIGSATKRARFRKKLAVLGHCDTQIDQIDCPIGDPTFGKHPQAIAVSITAALLTRMSCTGAPDHASATVTQGGAL